MSNLIREGFNRHPLSDADMDAMYKAVTTDKERLCLFTLLHTGLRVSEFTGLTKESLFFNRRLIILRGKGKKQRSVPMSKTVHDLLYHHFSLHDTIGMTPRTVNNVLKRLKKKAGVEAKVHPHILRHTFAVNALRGGMDINALRLMLGHTSLAITQIYLRYTEDYVKESFDKIGW